MSFFISHIYYYEDNFCTDRFVTHGIIANYLIWWDFLSSFIQKYFFKNRYVIPYFIFTSLYMSFGCLSSIDVYFIFDL